MTCCECGRPIDECVCAEMPRRVKRKPVTDAPTDAQIMKEAWSK